jgi:leucine-rich PPR motif-containing protein
VKAALDRFEWCCVQHHATPWKNEIACRLIQAEDPSALQRLTDLSTQVHGEVNSLYDLVLAFVECGRVRQARRILEVTKLFSFMALIMLI